MWRLAALLVMSAAVPLSQPSAPVFDAASVKPSTLDAGEERWNSHITPSPAGLTIRAHTLRDCILWAWSLKEYQLVGPAWMDSEKYDITAKSPVAQPPDRLRLMLQSLLRERFRLALHHDSRQLPVYVLMPARAGPKVRAATSERAGVVKLPGPGLRLSFQRASLPQVADFLSSLAAVDRPVLDATGLDGLYDFTLDLRAAAGPWPSEAERQTAPSVSTVLEAQLGLRLASGRHVFDVLVVDRAQRVPLPN